MAVAVHEPVHVPKVKSGHSWRKSSQLDPCDCGFSPGSASNATSKSRISHTFRPSMRFGAGIRRSRTSSSNLLAEMPTYTAASPRDRPRRGIGRTVERVVERVMLLSPAAPFGHGVRRRIEANIRASGHSLGGGWCNPCRDRDDKPDRGPLSVVNQMPSSSRGETQARAALSRSGVSGRIRSRDGSFVWLIARALCGAHCSRRSSLRRVRRITDF